MKIAMEERTYHGRKVIRFTAKLIKSEKHGIPSTVQKTWRVFADADDSLVDARTIKTMFHAEAKRWQHKKMVQWFGSPEKFPQQQEIEDVRDEEGQQSQPVPGVPEGGLVSGGEVSGPVHEDRIPSTEGHG